MNDCCCKSKFLIGLGLGTVLGAVCCHLARTQQAKELRMKVNDAIQCAADKAQSAWQSARQRVTPPEGEIVKE